MQTIQRNTYLNELISRRENGLIKVITGIRRCGKSFLLFNLFYNYLLSDGVKEDNIIKIMLDDDANEEYRDPKKLSAFIRERLKNNNEMHYVFIDEVQYAIRKEDLKSDEPLPLYGVLNGLLRLPNVDVYVTGSNSKLLSKDVMTEFRGRGDEVRIYPLSFKEYYGFAGVKWGDFMMLKGKTASVPPRTASVSKRKRLREVQSPLVSTMKEA